MSAAHLRTAYRAGWRAGWLSGLVSGSLFAALVTVAWSAVRQQVLA